MKNIFFTLFVLAYSFCNCNICEASKSSDVVDERVNNLLTTVDGFLLFYGWKEGKDFDYDTSILTEEQKQDYKNTGLKEISDSFDSAESTNSHELAYILSETLARHYLLKKDTKKSLFWSFKAAEHGSSFCMRILSNAYGAGDGIVQDIEESIKWKYLGAAAGDERCKDWVKETNTTGFTCEKAALLLKEGQARAKNWMKTHEEIFFNKN